MAFEFYDLLGVPRDASADDLKRAYRKKAMELHPDRHAGDKAKEAEFKRVNEAYSVLSEPTKRAYYDRHGTVEPQGGMGGGAGFDGFSDLGDIFESFFGGGFSGGPRRRNRDAVEGEDIEIAVDISFEEAYAGVRKTERFPRRGACADCGGTGAKAGSAPETCSACAGQGRVRERTRTIFGTVEQAIPCPNCGGSGRVAKEKCAGCRGERLVEERISQALDIPAGVADGMTIKMAGAGHAGINAPAGDLLVHLRVEESKGGLVRRGNDLHWNLSVHPAEAALGARRKLRLPVLGERVVEIAPGTQHGHAIRFRNDGMRHLGADRRGDLVVTVSVEIPKRLSRRERELFEEIAREQGFDVPGMRGAGK